MLAHAWRSEGTARQVRLGGGQYLTDADQTDQEAFVWRHGRDEVKLIRDGDGWTVILTSTSRLLGPRMTVYQQKHSRMTLAAWDVMARVIRASRDEEEGVRVGRSAARWMRRQGFHEEPLSD